MNSTHPFYPNLIPNYQYNFGYRISYPPGRLGGGRAPQTRSRSQCCSRSCTPRPASSGYLAPNLFSCQALFNGVPRDYIYIEWLSLAILLACCKMHCFERTQPADCWRYTVLIEPGLLIGRDALFWQNPTYWFVKMHCFDRTYTYYWSICIV